MRPTIFIPVYTNKKTIFQVISAITTQTIPATIHILLTENNQLFAKDFKKYPVKLTLIKKKDFHHSKTRNLALKHTQNPIIVFLSADAIPKNKFWLENLIKPLKNKNVAGTFSRQIPYKNARLSEKFFYTYHFSNTDETRPKKNPKNVLDAFFFSNVSSAIKRDVFNKYPFSEKVYIGEDQFWSKTVLNNGYKTQYVAQSIVHHSHNFTLTQTFQRYYDSAVTLGKTFDLQSSKEFLQIGSGFTIQTIIYILKKNPLKLPKELLYIIAKTTGTFVGKNKRYLPKSWQKKCSYYNS